MAKQEQETPKSEDTPLQVLDVYTPNVDGVFINGVRVDAPQQTVTVIDGE